MDATEEHGLDFQKSSQELIALLKRSLPRFLLKKKRPDGGDPSQIRGVVRQTKTDELLEMLAPFQELPQLLDPHLSDLLQPLVSAFIEYVSTRANKYHQCIKHNRSPDVIPLPRAVCQILYLYCKIRGEKVIVRFLNNEPRFLEPMLDALEDWASGQETSNSSDVEQPPSMLWQEKFIMLLWLSHLMLAPFDITSMASTRLGNPLDGSCIHIDLPARTPPIARRLTLASIHYLNFPSKEREAAGILLARLALRPDMQAIGLQESIIERVCAYLEPDPHSPDTSLSIYTLLGLLSFIAKFLISADNKILLPLLQPIYKLLQHIRSQNSPQHRQVSSSTLARRLTIKISRIISVASIKIDPHGVSSNLALEDDALGDLIDYFLTILEDKDTSVRMAASKAMSLVVVTLEPDMADQVISDLMTSLSEDVRQVKDLRISQKPDEVDPRQTGSKSSLDSTWCLQPDLSAVDATKWHGIVLTLAQLSFRRALVRVPSVIGRLLPALHFEQRSPLGVSLGTNVRDAACFGIWSVARRYTTDELSMAKDIPELAEMLGDESMLQFLANNLLVAATLDIAGNIRRGASAALQEMIGRHPDSIKHGISLIQVVDYHSIALQSRAILEVAVSASEIDGTYRNAILESLLGWRGIGSSHARIRRQAAQSIGEIAFDASHMSPDVTTLVTVRDRLRATPAHEVEKRHGLFLALAYIVATGYLQSTGNHDLHYKEITETWSVLFDDHAIASVNIGAASQAKHRSALASSNFTIEAHCHLISALTSDPLAGMLLSAGGVSTMQFQHCIDLVNYSLLQIESIVTRAGVEAAVHVFRLLDHTRQHGMIVKWANVLRSGSSGLEMNHSGVISALGAVWEIARTTESENAQMFLDSKVPQWIDSVHDSRAFTSQQDLILKALLEQFSPGKSIDMRCFALNALTSGIINIEIVSQNILNAIHASLRDYTINEKGDVGSLLRIEAIDAVLMLFTRDLLVGTEKHEFVAIICGLAAEKLDKVRLRAWSCLRFYVAKYGIHDFESQSLLSLKEHCDKAQVSSMDYFCQLMSLSSIKWIRKPLLHGYITSAGAGSESLMKASRVAFVLHAGTLPCERVRELWTTVVDIFQDSLNTGDTRLLLPSINLIVFLFEADIIHPKSSDRVSWVRFLNLVQRAHYKSTNTPMIEAAVRLYAALATFLPVRGLTMKKLCQMLLHPYAKVRRAAAESLFILTNDEGLLKFNSAKSVRELKAKVQEFQNRLGSEWCC